MNVQQALDILQTIERNFILSPVQREALATVEQFARDTLDTATEPDVFWCVIRVYRNAFTDASGEAPGWKWTEHMGLTFMRAKAIVDELNTRKHTEYKYKATTHRRAQELIGIE